MKKKNEHAVSLAKARSKSMTSERRSEIASNAAKAGWAKGAYKNRARRLSTGRKKGA